MTDHDMVADAKAQAQQLGQDAEQFLTANPLPPVPGEEPTLPMSAAELWYDDDE